MAVHFQGMWKWAAGLQLLIAGICFVSSRSSAQQESASSDLLSGTARTLQRTAQDLSREALYAALVGQQLLPTTRNVVDGVIQATAGGLRQGAEVTKDLCIVVLWQEREQAQTFTCGFLSW